MSLDPDPRTAWDGYYDGFEDGRWAERALSQRSGRSGAVIVAGALLFAGLLGAVAGWWRGRQ